MIDEESTALVKAVVEIEKVVLDDVVDSLHAEIEADVDEVFEATIAKDEIICEKYEL